MFTRNKFAKLQLLFALFLTIGITLLLAPTVQAAHEPKSNFVYEHDWTIADCEQFHSNFPDRLEKCKAAVNAANNVEVPPKDLARAACAGNPKEARCIQAYCQNTLNLRDAAFNECMDGIPVDDGDGITGPDEVPDGFDLPPIDDSDSAATSENCESKGGSFSFVVCPLLSFLNQAFTTLDNWIINAMNVDSDYYKSDTEVKQVWQNIRNIAYFILIPIMLLMVIGTALNVGFLDPYTVRRAMPRLLTAVVFMALSFDVCAYLIKISNVVGQGIAGIIAQPFKGMSNLELTDIFNPGVGSDVLLVGGVVGAVALGFVGFATIGIIASFLFVGVITLLIIFVLLAFRELLIIFLIVMSPIAILSWIFKGNDKLWKLWWSTFSKLLLLFPVVMAFLVMGRAFARIAQASGTADGGGDVFTTIIKLIAFIAPYFLIPSAFKFAGGAFANIAGMANDRSRGFFDKQRKKRGEAYSHMRHDYKAGSLYSNRNRATRGMNNLGQRIGVGRKGRYGVGEQGRGALDRHAQISADEQLKNNLGVQKLAFDDDANAVLALSQGSEAGAKEVAKKLFTKTDAVTGKTVYDAATGDAAIARARGVGFNRANAQAALMTLAQNKARSVPGGADGRAIIQEGINGLAPNNPEMASNLRDNFAYHANAAGALDFAGTKWSATGASGVSTASLEGFERGTLYQAGSSQPRGIEQATIDAENLLKSGNEKDIKRAAQHYYELQQMGSSATGPARDTANKSVEKLRASGIEDVLKQRTGNISYATSQINYDRSRAAVDPTYSSQFNADEIARGSKNVTRVVHETVGELARKDARVYEPPNPNRE